MTLEIKLTMMKLHYLLGDGGEDVCCTLEAFHLDITDTESEGRFPAEYVDGFLERLKCFFISGLVYPSLHMRKR